MSSIILGMIILLVCYVGIGLYYSWRYILLGAGIIIGIYIILFFTVGKKICPYCGKKYYTLSKKPCPECGGIDFGNIETVDILCREMTYRIEEEEEFDIVKTDFLTRMDGWQHYETTTIEHKVPNGYEYTFLVCYLNGKEEKRKIHESSPLAKRLIEISGRSSLVETLEKGFTDLVENIQSLEIFCNRYITACENFELMCKLYGLKRLSTDDEILEAVKIKLTSIITVSEEERRKTLIELMTFLLCESDKDADMLEYPLSNKVDFIQKHPDGTDAFCILEFGADVYDYVIYEYDNIRKQKDYRKICILTVGENKAEIDRETVVVWDTKKLIEAYLTAFKKIIRIICDDKNNKVLSLDSDNTGIVSSVIDDTIVIDIETTGLNHDYKSSEMDEILSVSIVDLDGNVILNELCGTERKRTWYDAERIHGISPRDVRGLPTFSDVLSDVLRVLSQHQNVIAYNVPFEKQFIEAYIKRRNPIDLVNYRINWRTDLDPMVMYMDYIGSNRWSKLEDAANDFGYTFNAHDSLEDAKATAFLYNKLR